MRKNYPPVKTWMRAPFKYEWTKLQTGESCILYEGNKGFVLAFCGELKIHPLLKGVDLPGKVVRREVYPPVSEWGTAPKEFGWINSLKNGEYTLQEDRNLTIYVVTSHHGKLKAHLRIPFAKMPEEYRCVRIERYPPIKEWREFYNQNIQLKNGEHMIVTNSRTGIGIYVLARVNNKILFHPYLDYAKFPAFE